MNPLSSVKKELSKTLIGQNDAVDLILITLLSHSHALLEGVPGLAKTLLVRALSKSLGLSFSRIQFTPDMMPSDITGTEIFTPDQKQGGDFRFIEGAVFANLVLADEINRTPPKTQSALLEAMQERRVTVLGKGFELPRPFFVIATQNPIEYEGTYPLPEAQLDRFLLHIRMDYPSLDDELKIMDLSSGDLDSISEVMSKTELIAAMESAEEIPASDKVKSYILSIVRATRKETTNLPDIPAYVEWGAGPRASQMILRAAKSRAYLMNKKTVDKEDVDSLLLPALSHRILLNYSAQAENIAVSDIIDLVRKNAERDL